MNKRQRKKQTKIDQQHEVNYYEHLLHEEIKYGNELVELLLKCLPHIPVDEVKIIERIGQIRKAHSV